jgi:hypothetical protein
MVKKVSRGRKCMVNAVSEGFPRKLSADVGKFFPVKPARAGHFPWPGSYSTPALPALPSYFKRSNWLALPAAGHDEPATTQSHVANFSSQTRVA